MLALALTVGLTPWMVFALVFARGCVNAVDYPTRQAFVMEIVGGERVVNAVSLNSVLVHSARVIGPAIAGVLIATVGVEPCFALNAASFGVMILALWRRWTPARCGPPRSSRASRGAVRAALRYVRATPELWIPLALMARGRHPRLQLPGDPAAVEWQRYADFGIGRSGRADCGQGFVNGYADAVARQGRAIRRLGLGRRSECRRAAEGVGCYRRPE